jgi:hypothetical protein
MVCGANKKCFVDKTSRGTFIARCAPLRSKRNRGKRLIFFKIFFYSIFLAACNQKKAIGSCKATLKRYYYNSMMNTCEQFIFKGCGGNDNNFETKRHCEATCLI